MEQLPCELKTTLLNYLDIHTLYSFHQTSNSIKLITLPIITQAYKKKINNIRENIIKTFNTPDVYNFRLSGIDLLNLLKKDLDFLKKFKVKLSSDNIDKENDKRIINTYIKNFHEHYVLHNIAYRWDDVDGSFVTSVLMYIYH